MAFPTQSIDLESGSAQFLSRATANALRLKNDFTIEMWVNFESLPSSGNNMWLMDKKSESPGEDFSVYAVYLNNNSGTYQIRLRTTNGSSSSNIDVGVNWTPSTGTWYHVAITREDSAGAVNFYINGVQQGTTQTGYVGTLSDNSDLPFYMGRYRASDTRYYDGRYSVTRLWSVVQSQSTINANKCVYYGSAQANMVAEWSFDNVLTDASGNGYTLTNNNSATFGADVPSVCAIIGPAHLLSFNGMAKANIGSINGIPIANISNINGIT